MKWWQKLFLGFRRYKQTTWCWCPECHAELTKQGKVEFESHQTDLVIYRCVSCQHISYWDFGAPVPLLMSPDPVLQRRLYYELRKATEEVEVRAQAQQASQGRTSSH